MSSLLLLSPPLIPCDLFFFAYLFSVHSMSSLLPSFHVISSSSPISSPFIPCHLFFFSPRSLSSLLFSPPSLPLCVTHQQLLQGRREISYTSSIPTTPELMMSQYYMRGKKGGRGKGREREREKENR